MKNSNNPTARQSGIVVQELPDEVLVYDMDSNKAHCLNRSAALVWRSCDGNNSVADIMKQFESTGGGKVTEDFVWLAIDQLNEIGLIENGVARRFEGVSRRQALKTIGLASMVALPVVASLMAPPTALGSVTCVCTNAARCTQYPAGSCASDNFCNGAGICAPN